MTQPVLRREGRVVETAHGLVVRFAAGCQAGAACHCALGGNARRELPPAALGLGREALPGRRVTVAVAASALSRLAAAVFAVPLVALVGGAWAGAALAPAAGIAVDAGAATVGLTALAAAGLLVARRGGALARSLELRACVDCNVRSNGIDR